MIFFIHKTTGKIIGAISGRVHDPLVLENVWMQSGDIKKDDILKYILPYEVLESGEYVPSVPFKELIYSFETGEKRVYDYKAILKNGEVTGLELDKQLNT